MCHLIDIKMSSFSGVSTSSDFSLRLCSCIDRLSSLVFSWPVALFLDFVNISEFGFLHWLYYLGWTK